MDTDLLNRYFQGKSTAEETLIVNEWLRTGEGEKYISDRIDEDIILMDTDETDPEHISIDSEKLFNRVITAKKELEDKPFALPVSPDSKGPVKVTTQRNPGFMQAWVRYAAVFAAILMMVFAFWFVRQAASITEQTGFGETKTITLPDGSTVILNGNTKISYTNRWKSDQPREVWLDGEAFFSVTHLSSHEKFLVHTSDNFNVEVLGTTFNVLKRENTTKVVLNSGKIKLNIHPSEEAAEQLLMNPGELVEFDNISAKYFKRKVNAEALTAWKVKKMVFENTSLSEIIFMLENTYGLKVEVSDPGLLDQKLNGTLPNENVDILLDGLSHLFNLKITKVDTLVTIESE